MKNKIIGIIILTSVLWGTGAELVKANDMTLSNTSIESADVKSLSDKVMSEIDYITESDWEEMYKDVDGKVVSDFEALSKMNEIIEKNKPLKYMGSIKANLKAAIKKYPAQAILAQGEANEAKNKSKYYYKSDTLGGGNGDAFRHTLWNALMTKSIGESICKVFADANELDANQNSKAEKLAVEMDYYNNAQGRQIGRVVGLKGKELDKYIMKWIDNGYCKRLNTNVWANATSLRKTDSSGKSGLS